MRATVHANARLPMNYGLNLAIPSAVRSGSLLSSYPPSLRCRALGAMLQAFKAKRDPHLGQFRTRKLVVSARHSKHFFAGVQCFTLMPAGRLMRAVHH